MQSELVSGDMKRRLELNKKDRETRREEEEEKVDV
jgi:hypothetical protein